MHVLHIKSSALDLKSAAKFTNWGLSSRSTETANDTRNSLTENMQAEHIKPLNWLKAGVAYQATTDIGVPYFGYPSAQIVDLNCAKTRLGWESFVLLLMLYRGIIRFPRKRTLWPVGRVEINSSEIPKSEIGGVWKARLNGIKVDAIKLPETEILRKRLCVKLHMSVKLLFFKIFRLPKIRGAWIRTWAGSGAPLMGSGRSPGRPAISYILSAHRFS